MKYYNYFPLVFMIAFFSCSNTFEKQVETSVHKQLEQFPESRLQDLYKNFFQDRFGPGHLIPDSAMAGNYLREELASYSGEYLPLVEEIGWEGNFVRVSTDVVKNGMLSSSAYLEAFVESANTTSETPIEAWKTEWNKILSVIDNMNLNLPDYEADKAKIQELIDSGKYAMHHSEAFEKAYEPHYRIIKKSIYEKQIIPNLSKQTIKKETVMEKIFCQSCGMPLESPEQFGTNKDGSPNAEYCIYCYKDGAFTQDVTMDEMIEHCAQFVEEFNKDSDKKLTKAEAITQMREYFPHLKRWQK
jgi:hypothetical protein